MLERDLQDYLFENPDVLFPGQIITRRRREVVIEGRRIDLLFEVDGVHYIVELKRDTITRETIGQIFEYYGLMRHANEAHKFKMILVAPSIPAYRRIPLEEFGIRCFEVQHRLETQEKRTEFLTKTVEYQRRERAEANITTAPPITTPIRFEDLLPPVNPASLQLTHLLLKDGLPCVQKEFSEYEILPVKMVNPCHPDVLCLAETDSSGARFVRVGAWWAFSFGHSEEMPKNDVPNISVNALPWGLDFAINAELRTSQEVMRRRIALSPKRFDCLVAEHGSLQLQAWLKFEHQPRFYHWVPLVQIAQGSWRGQDLLDLHRKTEADFPSVRSRRIAWIREHRPELTPRQITHMERSNRTLNLAFRLVHSFQKEDALWNLPYEPQKAQFEGQYCKLKPLIDFFNETLASN
jgi:Endonuclease NucS